MAHFAELDSNNVVLRVVVINNEILRENVTAEVDGLIEVAPIEKESKGVGFLKGLYGAETNWKQTSYNGGFRGKYAGIGDTFDGTNFVAPEVVISTEQVQVLETVQVQALTTDQIQALTTDQISALGA